MMKALDPTSTVREGEFQKAASSAGVLNEIGNTWNKIAEGKDLTPVQKKAFKRLTTTWLKNQSKQYDRIYDNMANVLKIEHIPDAYLPTRASEDAMKIAESA